MKELTKNADKHRAAIVYLGMHVFTQETEDIPRFLYIRIDNILILIRLTITSDYFKERGQDLMSLTTLCLGKAS